MKALLATVTIACTAAVSWQQACGSHRERSMVRSSSSVAAANLARWELHNIPCLLLDWRQLAGEVLLVVGIARRLGFG